MEGVMKDIPSAVTLGKFDGVHLGHQKLLQKVLDKEKEGMRGIMFAIDSRDTGILTEEEREDFVSDFGIDVLIECPFSRELMTMSPEKFLSFVLKDTLHASYVVVGTDFCFGYRRAGNADTLLSLQEKFGYQACIIDKECYGGEEISSTRVRTALQKGDMELVAALLGRTYTVTGEVLHGRHLGSSIGFPTANLIPGSEKLLPPDGVYVSVTSLQDGRRLGGVTNIGTNPTIGEGNVRSVETNLFDFNEDIYGQKTVTSILHRIRGEMIFGSVSQLSARMAEDAQAGREYLKSTFKA